MARKTKLTPYGEQIVEAIDDDGPESISYRSPPSTSTKGDFLSDDALPLFLSNHAEEAQQPGVGKARDKAAISSRMLRTGGWAAAAIAIVLAIFSVENPLALFASATASLTGISTAPSGATPLTSDPAPVLAASSADTDPSTQADRPTAGGEALSPTETDAPTRDEIAAAFKIAHQSLAEIRQPPAAVPPPRRLDADELAALLERAKSMIAIGDIAAARLLLERAADAQEAGAALLLAQTYDPAVLGTPDARSIAPDPATARDWYQKAAQFGSLEALQRLAQLQN
jgi:hypothetical protein